ncbi:MAG: hypothetical protein WC350_01320 [Candidatus Micrarchaeia archaeon]|jgi:hypothetical protein
MSRKERIRRDTGADGIHGKEGLLDRISGIRAKDARKLMEEDEYRTGKAREADECRKCAAGLLKKDPRLASEMLERAADVYRILGEMEPDAFKLKEFCLTASRLYGEAGWLTEKTDAARAAQLIVKSGEALECMHGKCEPCKVFRGMINWKNAARVKYSSAFRLLTERAERLSRSTSIQDRRRGLALGQEAEELHRLHLADAEFGGARLHLVEAG